MAGNVSPGRPSRADVAAAYDLGVEAYVSLWSAVILPPARAVVGALDLYTATRVIDVGAGSGALVPSIKEVAPSAAVIAIDASLEMLRAARARTGTSAVHADAMALPVRDGAVDAALVAFVLFHLRDPVAALREVARVLRPGGEVGTVTWKSEAVLRAFSVWDATLTEGGAPPLPARRVDTGLDSPQAISETLGVAGFEPTRTWIEPLRHQWSHESYWAMATGSGLNRLRLSVLDEAARARTLARAHERLFALPVEDYSWSGEVVCAVAMMPTA